MEMIKMIKDNNNSCECNHEYKKLGNPVLKTIDGFYKNKDDYKEGNIFSFILVLSVIE